MPVQPEVIEVEPRRAAIATRFDPAFVVAATCQDNIRLAHSLLLQTLALCNQSFGIVNSNTTFVPF